MNFEDYLVSKKIDTAAFRKAEPALWEHWRVEFEQLHPASFTAQKLYLINPIRRKYTLIIEVVKKEGVRADSTSDNAAALNSPPSTPKPGMPKPMMRPKPKMN